MVRRLLLVLAFGAFVRGEGLPAARPNILLVLADDLGWSDLGCYGGEIRTPNLDALAAGGLRFTQFYNSARCCPSRASLLTGLYPHQAGVGLMTGDRGEAFPGYRGRLNDGCVTLAQVLKAAGYRTAMCGKWHVGDDVSPVVRGFDDFYGFPRGYGVDSFDPRMMVRLPEGRRQRRYPEGKFFATDAITDHALDFLRGLRGGNVPWFLYIAYQAPHFPVQTLPGDAEGYDEIYSAGWDAIREGRLARQKAMGLMPKGISETPRSRIPHPEAAKRIGSMTEDGRNPPWASLDEDRRADLARRMVAFAGMVSGMDRNIGRVVEDLRERGELENTLVLFLSDNGACAEWEPFGFDLERPGAPPAPGIGINMGTQAAPNVMRLGAAIGELGAPGSFISYGCAWANASNTPFRLYKHYCHEGGIRTPLIVHWPAGIGDRGALRAEPGHIIDIMPTLAELAGARYPGTLDGHTIQPMEGVSLVPVFRGKAMDRNVPLFFEHERSRAVRDGPWKAVVAAPGDRWELYDMKTDPLEMNDLAAKMPERVAAMASQWQAWAERAHVLPVIGEKAQEPARASVVDSGSFRGNRAPLQAKAYSELPIGSIEARGWLLDQLKRMAAGMTGHLDEWYPEALGPRNAWLGGDGDAWERGPYWVDGLYPLAHLLKDESLKAKAMEWVEWTLNNQREDGYIGPRPTEKPPKQEPGLQRDRQEDWWPKMVMLKILQQHHSATGDPRAIGCLTRYFRYQMEQLPAKPLDHWSWWGKQRGGDNLMVVLWLYNVTGEAWLMDLARLLVKQTLPFTDIFLEGSFIHHHRGTFAPPYAEDAFHCVNLAQGMKTPLVAFQLDGDPRHMEATRRAFRDVEVSHGQPHGLYGADEGMHGRDLDRGSELCTAVEMMFSLEKMLEITGEIDFADRLEKIAYNALPTQVTDDFRTKQYYQQANQVEVTFGLRSFHNHHYGDGLVYGLCTGFQCCTCNLHQGWPKFVGHLWMASRDGGLAAMAYGPCRVTARVAGGAEVTISEETQYPFDETVTFTIDAKASVEFPLHLRIPGWCNSPAIEINGKAEPKPERGRVAVLKRAWAPGDRVTLTLPMVLGKSHGHERSVAIERGPLVYALRIEEVWSEVRPEDRQFGYRECRPGTPWNYALLESDLKDLEKGFGVAKAASVADYPWTLEAAPIELRGRGVRVPQWEMYDNSAGRVPMSPLPRVQDMKPEPIRLIPYGCTTLRISGFPWMQDKGGRVRPQENQ